MNLKDKQAISGVLGIPIDEVTDNQKIAKSMIDLHNLVVEGSKDNKELLAHIKTIIYMSLKPLPKEIKISVLIELAEFIQKDQDQEFFKAMDKFRTN